MNVSPDAVNARQRLCIAAAITGLLSLAFLWGSMHVARMPGGYSDNLQIAAYLQFLLFGILGATTVVALLNAFRPASRPTAVLMALVAAFAVVVASFGLLAVIGVVAGHQIYQRLGLVFPLGMAVLSIAIYWRIARGLGISLVGSLLGAIIALTFVPWFYVGAFLFCVLFTPNCRIHF